jgi:hypothetical protein
MVIEYLYGVYKPGTTFCQVFLYEEDGGDAIMTLGPIYEDELDMFDSDAEEEIDEDKTFWDAEEMEEEDGLEEDIVFSDMKWE